MDAHELDRVGRLGETSAWINRGAVAAVGPTAGVVEAFVADGESPGPDMETGSGMGRLGPDDLVRAVELVDPNGQPMRAASSGRPARIRDRQGVV